MDSNQTKELLNNHLNILADAAKDSSRSGEELKAITEAVKLTIELLTLSKNINSTHCDSNGHCSKGEKSITNPLIKN